MFAERTRGSEKGCSRQGINVRKRQCERQHPETSRGSPGVGLAGPSSDRALSNREKNFPTNRDSNIKSDGFCETNSATLEQRIPLLVSVSASSVQCRHYDALSLSHTHTGTRVPLRLRGVVTIPTLRPPVSRPAASEQAWGSPFLLGNPIKVSPGSQPSSPHCSQTFIINRLFDSTLGSF